MNPLGIPSHLPPRLAVCMWDYAWYSMSHPDDPDGDLDRALELEVMGQFHAGDRFRQRQ